ncbi:MAG: flagellin lysine-N-methylase [Clostridia bacterium]|nr:flagellin lysine-N-methylase [Clostridia bacterium]
MKQVMPAYYPAFRCVAEQCRHNCCIGWEIDIDADTYALYQEVPGDFGRRLGEGIAPGEPPTFRLDGAERCVFLNDRGLCDIISTLGEEALCDICREHPRFYNEFTDRLEMGLGLCCEEAARLIVNRREPVTFLEEGEETPTPEEAAFFAARSRAIETLQDRTRPLMERIAALCPADTRTPAQWAAVYRDLERLDGAWDGDLDRLAAQPVFSIPDEVTFEQLAVYFLYRHLKPEDFARRLAFSLHAAAVIVTLGGEVADTARRYSAEVEYSDENIDCLLDCF